MWGNLNGWHLIILLAVILLVFGAAKLPALAKSLGQSARVFKGEMKAMKDDDAAYEARKHPEGTAQATPYAGTDATASAPTIDPPAAPGESKA